jgi:hypothetical protein
VRRRPRHPVLLAPVLRLSAPEHDPGLFTSLIGARASSGARPWAAMVRYFAVANASAGREPLGPSRPTLGRWVIPERSPEPRVFSSSLQPVTSPRCPTRRRQLDGPLRRPAGWWSDPAASAASKHPNCRSPSDDDPGPGRADSQCAADRSLFGTRRLIASADLVGDAVTVDRAHRDSARPGIRCLTRESSPRFQDRPPCGHVP